MTRETETKFEGRENVTKVTNDNGAVSYLTQSQTLAQVAYEKQASDFAIYEGEKKHVFFLFEGKVEKARFYLGQKLQNKGMDYLSTVLNKLVVFESWNPNTNSWVPCIGLSEQKPLETRKLAF